MSDDDLQTTVNDDVAAAFDSVEEAAGEVMPEVDDAPKPEDGRGNLEDVSAVGRPPPLTEAQREQIREILDAQDRRAMERLFPKETKP